jgi:prevent-host-death family protein
VAKIVPFSEARAELGALLDELATHGEHVVITRNGRPAGILLSPEHYESVEETLDVLADRNVLDALDESERDVRAGRIESLDAVRRRLGRS